MKNYATAVGEYADATVEFELQGTPTAGDYIELAWLDQHFNYRLTGSDTLESAASALAAAITANQAAGAVSATASGTHIVLTYHGAPGSNGNRIGVYGTVQGAGTESWSPAAAKFAGGSIAGRVGGWSSISPRCTMRRARWYRPRCAEDAVDVGGGLAERRISSAVNSAVAVTNWRVSGTKLQYSVAGTGSRRIEDDAAVAL